MKIADYVKKYDQDGMLKTINDFPFQISDVWKDPQFKNLKVSLAGIHNVVVVGMGSSLIAYKVLESVFSNVLKLPVFVENGENLPNWADEHTILIASSYSGKSIETVCCTKQAIQKKCTIIGIGTGGYLEQMKDLFAFFTR